MNTRSYTLTRDMVLNNQSFRAYTMSPSQFCEKWIPILHGLYPDERGYKAACIRELQSVTGLGESTIKSWGGLLADYPKTIERTLYWANMGYSVKHALGFRPNQEIQ